LKTESTSSQDLFSQDSIDLKITNNLVSPETKSTSCEVNMSKDKMEVLKKVKIKKTLTMASKSEDLNMSENFISPSKKKNTPIKLENQYFKFDDSTTETSKDTNTCQNNKNRTVLLRSINKNPSIIYEEPVNCDTTSVELNQQVNSSDNGKSDDNREEFSQKKSKESVKTPRNSDKLNKTTITKSKSSAALNLKNKLGKEDFAKIQVKS